MEVLETRQLLSLTITPLDGLTFNEPTTAVAIVGSAEADVIQVFFDAAARQYTVNPMQECMVLGLPVTRVLVYGEGGDDLIQVRGGITYFVDGGDGNDTISGSSAGDWLDGGAGDDVVAGALGADYLVGGEGHDRLLGGKGGDVLVGDSGVDELFGGLGWDIVGWADDDLVVKGEDKTAGVATPPDAVLDPNEVVTPELCIPWPEDPETC